MLAERERNERGRLSRRSSFDAADHAALTTTAAEWRAATQFETFTSGGGAIHPRRNPHVFPNSLWRSMIVPNTLATLRKHLRAAQTNGAGVWTSPNRAWWSSLRLQPLGARWKTSGAILSLDSGRVSERTLVQESRSRPLSHPEDSLLLFGHGRDRRNGL